jgi:hypothetical protein
MDIEPDLQKLQRGGESADAATDHRDLEAHARLPVYLLDF